MNDRGHDNLFEFQDLSNSKSSLQLLTLDLVFKIVPSMSDVWAGKTIPI